MIKTIASARGKIELKDMPAELEAILTNKEFPDGSPVDPIAVVIFIIDEKKGIFTYPCGGITAADWSMMSTVATSNAIVSLNEE